MIIRERTTTLFGNYSLQILYIGWTILVLLEESTVQFLYYAMFGVHKNGLFIHSTLNGQNMKIHCPTLIKYSYCMIC